MTKYAVTQTVANHSNEYLTAGRSYEVLSDDGRCFSIRNDKDDVIYCLWNDCPHTESNWAS